MPSETERAIERVREYVEHHVDCSDHNVSILLTEHDRLKRELARLIAAGDGLARNVNPCLLEMARFVIGNTNVAVIEHWIKQWNDARIPTPREKEADQS